MHATETTAEPRVLSARPSRGWRIFFGLVTVAAGVAILVWPGVAVVTVAVILGIHFIVAGAYRSVTALTRDIDNTALRVLYLLLGLLLVVVGLLCLRSPWQASAVLVVLFGLSWVVNGVVEMFHGVNGGGGWTIASGVISLLAGLVVLIYPAPGLAAIVWLFGVSLVVIGGTVTISGAAAKTRP
ncbi:HdeD family acid-resistance protein [Actinokineospora inagensis]|uniref:HdeD family acid-resistance protein n=1 Tax=Actinokineospora inagensis TaxID=103730 RepID=UPI00041D6A3C|nr:DUF308 domain-containing protein [Actinokineospora inagensis]